MLTFNKHQYDDLLNRSVDLYAHTKYQIILNYLAGRRQLDILNAGCGSGDLSLLLEEAGHQVLGIDPITEYVLLAQQRAEERGASRCSYLISSIEDFTTQRLFDCVIATDVLEHIEDDGSAFQKLVAHVRPGGLIIITVPAGQWLFGYHDEQLGHFRRYSRKSLRQLVSPLCNVESIRYFGYSLIPVCYLYSKLLRKPYPVAESGDSGSHPFRAWVLRSLLQIDRRIPMPLGTSLIMMGTREDEADNTKHRRRFAAETFP